MRVVIVITKGELGGAQTHVLELCRALRDRCEFLVLIGGSPQSPLQEALATLNIRSESIGSLSNSLSPRALLASIREIARHARAWDAYVMHVHSAVAAVVGRIAGRLARIPVVYTVHGFAFKPQFPLLRRVVAYGGERLLASFSRHVICVSPAERELTLKLGVPPARVSVIANGISDNTLRAYPSREPPSLIMVARMAMQKRHDLLLEALRVLRERGMEPPRTLLAGDGPLGGQLRRQAQESQLSCVDFRGDISNVAEMLSQCQLFVLLSRYEGHPISVIEAMRAGLPILATDMPGIRALVTDGVEGLLTSDDPAEIADALQRLLADPEMRSRMGAAARRRYVSEFSAFTMAEQVSTVYEEAARKPKRLAQELMQ